MGNHVQLCIRVKRKKLWLYKDIQMLTINTMPYTVLVYHYIIFKGEQFCIFKIANEAELL